MLDYSIGLQNLYSGMNARKAAVEHYLFCSTGGVGFNVVVSVFCIFFSSQGSIIGLLTVSSATFHPIALKNPTMSQVPISSKTIFVISFARNHITNATNWIFAVSITPRYHMNMWIHYSLSCGCAVINSNIISISITTYY